MNLPIQFVLILTLMSFGCKKSEPPKMTQQAFIEEKGLGQSRLLLAKSALKGQGQVLVEESLDVVKLPPNAFNNQVTLGNFHRSWLVKAEGEVLWNAVDIVLPTTLLDKQKVVLLVKTDSELLLFPEKFLHWQKGEVTFKGIPGVGLYQLAVASRALNGPVKWPLKKM